MTKTVRFYATIGVLYGVAFPVAAIVIDQLFVQSEWRPIGDLIAQNPLHLIIMLAPVVLGIVFGLLGAEHERGLSHLRDKNDSDHEFKLLVAGISDYAIYMLDTEGRVKTWNAGAQAFKGYTADEIIGEHFAVFYDEADRSSWLPERGLALARANGKHQSEGWRLRKDGSRFWAQASLQTLRDETGTHIGFAKITRDCTAQKEASDRIEHLAHHDTLTGLASRAYFMDGLAENLLQAETLAVVTIYLHHLREINDTQGHEAGDTLLRIVGERLGEPTDRDIALGRFGGNEFAASFSYENDDDLAGFVSALRASLSRPVTLGETTIEPVLSMGIAMYPADSADSQRLVNNAGLAMERAKISMDGVPCYFDASMDDIARDRLQLAKDMKSGIEAEEFFLHFQEQRSAESEKLVGYEVLLRWQHPARGLISPVDFIPLAEETGLIVPLGAWVIRSACEQAMRWGLEEKIAINISAVQLGSPGLIETVKSALVASGLPPARLELEVTESALIADKVQALHILRQLKALGVSIAIDDFGTGYSSLDTLRAFPFDRIKIDRSFVIELENSRQCQAILRAILALGKSLDVSVLAEGVETRHQLSILAGEGCDEIQGFLFGRPATLGDLRDARQTAASLA